MNTFAGYAVTILVSLGAAGLVSLLTIKAQKRKLLSESGKTDAEAAVSLAEAYRSNAATQITLLEPYQSVMKRQQEEIDEQAAEIKQLRRYIQTLTNSLRHQGVEVPEMPDRVPTPVTDENRRTRS